MSNPLKKIMKMKKFIFSLGLIAMLLNLTNCAQYEDVNPSVEVKGDFELYASISRTANDGLNTVWSAKDEINVFHAEAGTTDYLNDTPYLADAEQKQNPFVCNDAAAGYFLGTLHGGELDATKAYDWYAFYPYSSYIKSPANDDAGYRNVGSASNAVQTQKGNDSMAHIGGTNYPMAGYAKNVAADAKPSLVFNHLSSLVEFEVVNKLSEAITVTEIAFTAEEDIVGSFYINFANPAELKFAGSGATYVSKTATLEVSGGQAIAAGQSAKFYAAIKPFTAKSGSDLTIKVSAKSATGTGAHEQDLTLKSDVVFSAGKIKPVKVNYTTEFEKPAEGVETLITTLANSNIAALTGGTGYADYKITDDNGFVYNVHAIVNKHSKATAKYKFMQIKSGSDFYIQIPNVGTAITKIEMVVSNANNPMTGGGNSAKLYFSSTKNTSNAVANGTGASSVTLSMPNNTLTGGYILAGAAVRVWEIKIYGISNGETPDTPDTPATPELTVTSETVAVVAAGGNAEFGYNVVNPAEGVSVSASTDATWISNFVYTTANKVSFTVAENTATEAREAIITLSYTGAESKTVTVKQAAASQGGDTPATKSWVRVTSTDMILSGGTFIIGYEATAKSGKLVPMRSDKSGATTSANGFHYSGTAVGTTTSNSSTIDMNTITDTSAYEFTISASTTVSGAVNIKRPDGNYIGNSNSKNTAKLYTSVSASTAYGVTIGANDVVTLSCAAATGYPTLQYNTGSPRFANYNKTQKNLVLYKLQ